MVLRSGFDVTIVIVAVAESLRDLHAAPRMGDAGAPPGPGDLVELARSRVATGTVDPAAFDAPYRRYSPEALLDLAERGRPTDPAESELVAVHGSASLDTVFFDGDRLSGWSTGDHPIVETGPGDRYRDLATMALDLAARVSPEALGPFLDAYGLDHPDVVRLDWHVLVDQLLR